MRIGHYQCVCPEWDFEENLNTLRRGLELAKEARLRIMSFPESSLTGYYRGEENARKNAFSVDSPEMNRALEICSEYDVMTIIGFNELRDGDLCNTAAVIDGGVLKGCYRKAFPVFDYFTAGTEFPVFEKDGLKFGIIICADSSYIEPSRILALKGARVIFAPHHNYVDDPMDHCLMMRHKAVARAIENRIYYVRCNNVMKPEGYGKPLKEGGVPYYGYGDSMIVNPIGELSASAGMHAEALMTYDLDLDRYQRPPDRKSPSRISAERLLDVLKETLENEQ